MHNWKNAHKYKYGSHPRMLLRQQQLLVEIWILTQVKYLGNLVGTTWRLLGGSIGLKNLGGLTAKNYMKCGKANEYQIRYFKEKWSFKSDFK